MISLGILTIWVFIQGWRFISGRAREPLMGLVGDSLKAVLVISLATIWAGGSGTLYSSLTTGLEHVIYSLVSDGKISGNDNVFTKINENLDLTSAAMSAITAAGSAQTGGDSQVLSNSNMLTALVAFGMGGPAVTGGAMVLMYEVAIALFVGFGPLFIVSLLFNATKQLFSRWLMYGVGTMFSLATLYVLSSIAMKLITVIAGVTWVAKGAEAVTGFSFGSGGLQQAALQTGGLGLILTTMLITCPPMAASFFQGMLGSFSPYSAINASGPVSGQPGPQGQPPGSYSSGTPAQGGKSGGTEKNHQPLDGARNRISTGDNSSTSVAAQSPGSRGAATSTSPNYGGSNMGYTMGATTTNLGTGGSLYVQGGQGQWRNNVANSGYSGSPNAGPSAGERANQNDKTA